MRTWQLSCLDSQGWSKQIFSACRHPVLSMVYGLLFHDENTKQQTSVKNEVGIIQGNLEQNS